jgi:3-oxoacyl-[acyl-carrier protein] reductase
VLDGRVALVTGGSGGIGAALVRALTAAGAPVAFTYHSGKDRAEELARETGTVALQADLADVDAAERAVEQAELAFGQVDILVANAGIGGMATVDEVDAELFDRTLAVNTRAPYLMTRRVLPGMRRRQFGRVLLTSSVAGVTGGVVGPHYAASKAALHGLVHHLAPREAWHGITINAIAPALITGTTMLPGEPEELVARIPVGRLGRPEEVADLALAMLRNGYMTNQVVLIDGGIRAG